ncbi:MAG: hypothetical protein FWG14_13850, partial [Peptococcaceae bacterium]|nr:hypothetical protein [Peptococcaceae bacterium]
RAMLPTYPQDSDDGGMTLLLITISPFRTKLCSCTFGLASRQQAGSGFPHYHDTTLKGVTTIFYNPKKLS